jgi:hypothetical protein
MPPRKQPAQILRTCAITLLATGFLLLGSAFCAAAYETESAFQPMTPAISVEGAVGRYQSGRLSGAYINVWNLGARISVVPFGLNHSRFLHGALDGALEVGLEPTFQRYNSVHQNFAGLLAEVRYHLVGLSWGPFVPWFGAAVGPGYSDLNIGHTLDDTKLEGPFMALILGMGGVEYFIDQHKAIYIGIEGQHTSNGGLNGKDRGSSTNVSLNTPWGLVVGASWYFR